VSNVGFAVAGVGLLTGVGLLVFAPKDRSVAVIGAQPIAGGAAVSWAGRF
jgi:hypothetical protein